MRVTIITVGTRGDVQPYVALGLGLQNAGHEVRLGTHPRFESFVRDRALEFAPLAEGSLSRGSETLEGRKWAEKSSKALPAWVGFLRDAKSVARRRLADCRDACEGAEAIIVSVFGTLLGYHLAEKMRVPLVRAYCTPFGYGLAHASPATSRVKRVTIPLGAARERLFREALWQGARPWTNAARRDVLGLPKLPRREFYGRLDRQRMPLLYGWSPAVFTLPHLDDWVHVTGYWFLDATADWAPPASLVEFMGAGPPPVFVSFGTLTDRNPEATTAVVLEALARADRRGIVLRASVPPHVNLPRDVFAIDPIPHDWLFPRVAAAVHHGGAGTTGAALRAGLPSVLVPRFGDQPFWGRRVADLGVGPPPIPRRRLSAGGLAEAIRIATTDHGVRERATALGERIRSEDGVARAVEAFERHLVAVAPRRSPVRRSS